MIKRWIERWLCIAELKESIIGIQQNQALTIKCLQETVSGLHKLTEALNEHVTK